MKSNFVFNMINYYVINFLYTLLFLPLATARLCIKAITNPVYKKRFYERYAVYYPGEGNVKIDLWFHTVSVGEFIAAKSLLLKLLDKTDNKILITCTTPTGSYLIEKFLLECFSTNPENKERLVHYYYPYDSNVICSRFLKKFQPRLAVFFETEIWPKMFRQLKKHKIKLFIINARLSEKSFKTYSKFLVYFQNIFPCIDYVATQGQNDYERFIKLGVSANKISVFGNIKYNLTLPLDLQNKSAEYKKKLLGSTDQNAKKIILIAASTHIGEDEILLNIYSELKKKYDNLILIIVPRHPERFQQVYELCTDINNDSNAYTICRFTELELMSRLSDNIDIFLLDTIGQLLYFYNISDVAFIGGSLSPVGGHNPLEPAVLKIASVIGPHYHNFSDIVDNLQESQGLLIADSAADLKGKIDFLLSDESYRAKIGMNAFNAMKQHQQVLNKYYDLIASNVSKL